MMVTTKMVQFVPSVLLDHIQLQGQILSLSALLGHLQQLLHQPLALPAKRVKFQLQEQHLAQDVTLDYTLQTTYFPVLHAPHAHTSSQYQQSDCANYIDRGCLALHPI
jgi:hypothetical protein